MKAICIFTVLGLSLFIGLMGCSKTPATQALCFPQKTQMRIEQIRPGEEPATIPAKTLELRETIPGPKTIGLIAFGEKEKLIVLNEKGDELSPCRPPENSPDYKKLAQKLDSKKMKEMENLELCPMYKEGAKIIGEKTVSITIVRSEHSDPCDTVIDPSGFHMASCPESLPFP